VKPLTRRIGCFDACPTKAIVFSADLFHEVNGTLKLLVVDDDKTTLDAVAGAIGPEDVRLLSAGDVESAMALMAREQPHIVLLDPATAGMVLLDRLLDFDPGVTVLAISADHSTDNAVEAIRRGAHDFLQKPLVAEALRQRLEQWQSEAAERYRTLQLDQQLLRAYRFEGMVGRSPLMLEVYSRIRRVAPHFSTVLVTGETGTGKELVASALHRLCPMSRGPFVVCNSTAIVETLFESELFGYVKGAFTGASQDRAGMFEFAHGGTLFMDEIGELPLAAQAKLLRVLQNQEVQRVGSPSARKVDVRVVAATNRDLRQMVAQKQFRDDLYYRLSMVEIRLPRLINRKEDLSLLERHFIESFAAKYKKPVRGITRRAQALLARYPWPGNVRELENILGYACMMTDREVVDVRDFPERLRTQATEHAAPDDSMLPLEELDRRHARRVLERVGGNRVRAAEILGISRATLYRMLPKNGSAA
jgi:DNA-binding NtrC family response regulator